MSRGAVVLSPGNYKLWLVLSVCSVSIHWSIILQGCTEMNEPGRRSRDVFGCRGGELKCHVELWFDHQATTSCGWCCLCALSVFTGQSFSKVVQR